MRALVGDRELRERLGDTAYDRASGFTWERTARENLAVLEHEAAAERAGLRVSMRGSETVKAAGLAAATLASNAIALLFTVLFARLLGADGYGSLAALISTFLILAVPGSALQVVVAREVATGTLGTGSRLASTIAAWRRALLIALAVVTACSVLLREPIADLLAVEQSWAAAATLSTGCLWLVLSIERGALQGVHAYREVGWSIVLEASGRLVSGLLLVAAGLGVTGAYLGTPVSMVVTAIVLIAIARRRIGVADPALAAAKLRDLVAGAWPAVIGLFLVAVLQNVDVILVKRTIGGDAAGAYAAAAVAAKAVVWVAIGVGLYLLPEATRKAGAGEDPRPVLLRALGVVAAVAVPMLVVYAVAPALVLRLAFGEETVPAAGALLVLGIAMTLLAAGYLCVQYMLALREIRFLFALGVAAVAEIAVLSGAGLSSIVGFATVVLALQAVAALAVFGLGLARRPPGDRGRRGVSAGNAGRAGAPLRVFAQGAKPGAEGWLTGAQAERLRSRAAAAGAGTIVEIGSFRGRSTIVLAGAAPDGARVVAIDPHAGSDRGPQEIEADRTRGDADHDAFRANLAAAGVAERVRHVRKPSADALGDVDGELALLYVDGAHRFAPARDDVARWGGRVRARRDDARPRRLLLRRRHRRAARRVRRARRLALRGPHGLARGVRAARRAPARPRARPRRRAPARPAALVRAQRALQGARAGRPAAGRAPPRPPGRHALALLAGHVARDAVAAVDRAGDRRVAGRERDRLGLVLARAEVGAIDAEQPAGGRVAGERPVRRARAGLRERAPGHDDPAARGAHGLGGAAVGAG